MSLFRAAYWLGGRSKKPPLLPKICHTHSTKIKIDAVIPYLNKTPVFESHDISNHKSRITCIWICMNHVTHSLSSADINSFSLEISKFCFIKTYKYRLHFSTLFLIVLTFFESLKVFKINMVTVLMIWAQLATPVLLGIKIFQNKGYEVIILNYDVTNKNLSRDWNYISDVVMWQKFSNSSISMTEIIITSIL